MDNRKHKDITGIRSGKLIAVKRTEEKRRGCTLWLCKCDCGNEILLEPYKISGGVVQSCGCSRKGKNTKDITGQRFGRLTALYRMEQKRGSSYLWMCQCDCGTRKAAPVHSLMSGNTTSCGCARTDALKNRAKDITGQKFGKLTAIRPREGRYRGSVIWQCRCDCGRNIDIQYAALVSGNTKSCGCLRTQHEQPPLHYIEGTCVEMLKIKKLRSDNTSGYTGVCRSNRGWIAQICFKGKRYYLGTYYKIEDAVKVRKLAEEQIFGEFLTWYNNTYGDGDCDNELCAADEPRGEVL